MRKTITRIYCDNCNKYITTQNKPAYLQGSYRKPDYLKQKSKKITYCLIRQRKYGMGYTSFKEFCSKECEKIWLKENGYD